MDALSATGTATFQNPPQTKSLKDLVKWRARIVKRLPRDACDGERRVPLAKLKAASPEIFLHRLERTVECMAIYEPASPKSIHYRLVALRDHYEIEVLHFKSGSMHSISECGDPDLNNDGFYFFLSSKEQPYKQEIRSSLIFYFCQDLLLGVASEFAALVHQQDFFDEVKACKFACTHFYENHVTPAIIYLYNAEPSEKLLEYVEKHFQSIPSESLSLRGARKIRKGVWHTQMLPYANGCQPWSRHHIVLSSFYLGQPGDDDETAIRRTAEVLGYQPDAPDRLAAKTPAFESMMFFVENQLMPNIDLMTDYDTSKAVLDKIGLAPFCTKQAKLKACEREVEILMKSKGVVVYSNSKKRLQSSRQWQNGISICHASEESKGLVKYDACLSIGLKAEYLHQLLALFGHSDLSTNLKTLDWKLDVDPMVYYADTPAPLNLYVSCSPDKLHDIAEDIRLSLPDDAFSQNDMYRQEHPGTWADIPGFERHAKGLSITQIPPDDSVDTSAIRAYLETLNQTLLKIKKGNMSISLPDLLANFWFEKGRMMHNPARTRHDLLILRL